MLAIKVKYYAPILHTLPGDTPGCMYTSKIMVNEVFNCYTEHFDWNANASDLHSEGLNFKTRKDQTLTCVLSWVIQYCEKKRGERSGAVG